MKPVRVTIRPIGNSQGVVIPKPLLAQLGLLDDASAEMSIESGALVLRKAKNSPRSGWAEASKAIARSGGDTLVMGEFGNEEDTDLEW